MKVRLKLVPMQKIDYLVDDSKEEILVGLLKCFEYEEGFNEITLNEVERNVVDGFAKGVDL